MSSFTLKIIAILAMLIDHMGAILFPQEVAFRLIGRIAFPIFVFLIVEGLHHTSNVRKYLTRLGIFALVSEIPFDLAFYQSYYNTNVLADLQKAFGNASVMNEVVYRFMRHQNVFFTLFLGLLAIYIIHQVEKKYEKEIVLSNIMNALVTIIFCALALFLRTDYHMAGILLIVAFYLFRGNKILLGLSILIVTGTFFSYWIQRFDIFAIIPIALYNGKKGKDIKYLFYIFYPAHLILLWLISYIS